MITFDDFTVLPEGTYVPAEGIVVRCPLCGRNGILLEEGLAGPCLLHGETTTVQGDGMLVEPTDYCPLPALGE